MGFPWRKVLSVGKALAGVFLPGVVSNAIDVVEDQVEVMREGGASGWSGPEKQQAALTTVLQTVAAYEGLKGEDVLNDATVAAAGREMIDAGVAYKEATAKFVQAIQTLKASKNPSGSDATGTP